MASTMTQSDIFYLPPTAPAFDGASQTYRHQQWEVVKGDADSLAESELALLMARTRHLVRNNAVAATAQREYVSSLGAVAVNWLKADGSKHSGYQDLWDSWASAPNLDGYGDFATAQATWNGERFTGEAIVRLVTVQATKEQKIPFRLHSIASEYLDPQYRGQDLATNITDMYKTRYGITFQDSRPLLYHFFPERYFSNSFDATQADSWKRVAIPASDILHIFERKRAGQWRGLPELTSVLIPLYDLDDLCDATIAKQKAAQAIAWIVEQASALTTVPIGVPNNVGKNTQTDPEKKIIFKANGGNVQYLNAGEKINFYQSTDIGANLAPFIKAELQKISAALGIPYHQLTNDTTSLDFSSIRAILIAFRVRLEFLHHTYTIPLGLTPLCTRFSEWVQLLYPRLGKATPSYQLPRKYGVDDLADAKADLLEVQSGFGTLRSKLEERHLTVEEIKKDRELITELGLDTALMPQPSLQAGSSNPDAASVNSGVKPNSNSAL